MPALNVSNANMGLDLDGESQIFPLPYIAYAQRMGSTSRWTLGLSAIVENHGTLGYGLNLGQWSLDAAYEHAFENTQTNLNDDPMVNPFGPGITVSHSQNTFHLGASLSF